MMVCAEPGEWGVMTLARRLIADHNDMRKVVDKLIENRMIESRARKLWPTALGVWILNETNDRQ